MESSDGILVRPAALPDIQGVLDIYNEAVLNSTASYDYEPRTLEQRIAWWEDHVRNELAVLVAVDADDQVVGWSALNRFHDRMGYRFTLENSIYIASECRGKGIGSRLMPPLIEAARARSAHAIIAAIDGSNDGSVRFHARFGFQQVGLLKEVGFKFGRWLDVVYMELLLDSPAR